MPELATVLTEEVRESGEWKCINDDIGMGQAIGRLGLYTMYEVLRKKTMQMGQIKEVVTSIYAYRIISKLGNDNYEHTSKTEVIVRAKDKNRRIVNGMTSNTLNKKRDLLIAMGDTEAIKQKKKEDEEAAKRDKEYRDIYKKMSSGQISPRG